MKYLNLILYVLVFFFVPTILKAQEKINKSAANVSNNQSVTITKVDSNRAFTFVEMEPTFPGGMDQFARYLQRNIKYPSEAKKSGLQGEVFIGFMIEKNGSLSDVKILRGVSPSIDREALRVISHSPKWKPAIQNGRPVRVQFAIPIAFTLPQQQVIKEQVLKDSWSKPN